MKATRIHDHGGIEALRYEDAERPVPGPGQVLIRVAAAGVNPADHKHRSGMFKDFVKYIFPKTLGYDVAGTVEALGPGVTLPAVGTRIFALLDPFVAGGYAEYVTTEAAYCAEMPDDMDFDTAAGIPCPALTGVQFVEEHLKPKEGDTVLITGATGMVGRFALLAAKAAGANVVAAVRSAYAEEARRLGADETINLGEQDWSGKPFDGVIDTVGGPTATALARHTKKGGRILTAATDPLDAGQLPSPPEFIPVHPDGARLAGIGRDVASGKAEVPIFLHLPLSEAGKAQELMEKGGVRGKIILLPEARVERLD